MTGGYGFVFLTILRVFSLVSMYLVDSGKNRGKTWSALQRHDSWLLSSYSILHFCITALFIFFPPFLWTHNNKKRWEVIPRCIHIVVTSCMYTIGIGWKWEKWNPVGVLFVHGVYVSNLVGRRTPEPVVPVSTKLTIHELSLCKRRHLTLLNGL
jgi:hypothetical protein